MGGDQGATCGLVLADLRQVQHHHFRCAEDDGAGERGRSRIAGWQIIDSAVLVDSFDAPRVGIGDGDEAELDLAAVMRQPDHVGRVQCQPRGWQAEGGAFPADPGFHQRAAAAAFGLLGWDRHRERTGRDARRVDGDAPCLDGGSVIILIRARNLPLQRLRQFRLLAARQLERLALAGGNQIVDGQRCGRGTAAHDEADHALRLDGIEAEMPG